MFQLTIRIGELKSFRFDDVDLEERTIRISKQALSTRTLNDDLTFSERETVIVNHTKKNTPQGKRTLRLTNEAIKIIKLAREINPDGEYIFKPQNSIYERINALQRQESDTSFPCSRTFPSCNYIALF